MAVGRHGYLAGLQESTSAQSKEGQNDHDDHNQTHQINDAVHRDTLLTPSRGHVLDQRPPLV
jgi:hypothetical protein